MGYTSDVAYIIHFDNVEQRDQFVTLMQAKNETYTNQALAEVEYRYSKHPIITFSADYQKWYDSYPDVQAHHRLMHDAVELYKAEYRFVRIGEDDNDIETQQDCDNYDLWDYVRPVRSIETDFPAPDLIEEPHPTTETN